MYDIDQPLAHTATSGDDAANVRALLGQPGGYSLRIVLPDPTVAPTADPPTSIGACPAQAVQAITAALRAGPLTDSPVVLSAVGQPDVPSTLVAAHPQAHVQVIAHDATYLCLLWRRAGGATVGHPRWVRLGQVWDGRLLDAAGLEIAVAEMAGQVAV